MKRVCIVTCLFVGILIHTPASAGPDQTTRYLMNQRVSLLTWGMYRIDQSLNKRFESHSVSSHTTYNYGPNTITISLSNVFNKSELKPTKQNCKYIIDETRRAAGIKPDTGQPMNGSQSFFNNYFGQTGYTANSRPENLGARVDEKIRINVSLGSTEGNLTIFRCKGNLLSRQVLFPE